MSTTSADRRANGTIVALWLGAMAVGVVALLASVVAVGVAVAKDDGSAAASEAGSGAGGEQTVQVSLGEF
jgi:hypothetical protein